MPQPGTIQDNTKVASLVVYGTHLTIHTALDTAVSGIANNTAIHSITITRKAVGNNFMAVVVYEIA